MKNDKNLKDSNTYDIVIVGGGMVGASLALALKDTAWKVAIIEARPFSAPNQPCYDDRSIAVSWGTSRLLEQLQLWPALSTEATAIKHIHVSDRGHLGATRLHAESEGVDALGYVVENRVLGKHFYTLLPQCDNVDILTPATVTRVEEQPEALQLSIQQQEQEKLIRGRLLVAADGALSQLRDMRGIGNSTHDYQQTAIITNITPSQDHQHIAYERFTENGPLALLPMSEQRCSLVWTHHPQHVEETMALSDDDFLKALQAQFGWRLGRFIKTGKRFAYPLKLIQAEHNTATRTVIMGNASHAIHPVAGQGYNLAVRDVMVLAYLLKALDPQSEHADPGDGALLKAYEAQRKDDIQTVVRFTHTLVNVFSNNWTPLAHLRAGGLMLVDRCPILRRWLARQSMGLNAKGLVY